MLHPEATPTPSKTLPAGPSRSSFIPPVSVSKQEADVTRWAVPVSTSTHEPGSEGADRNRGTFWELVLKLDGNANARGSHSSSS